MTLWEFVRGKEICPRCAGTGETDRGYGDIIKWCDLCDNEGFVKIYRIERLKLIASEFFYFLKGKLSG